MSGIIINPYGFAAGFENTYSMNFDGVDEYFKTGIFSALDGLEKATFSFWIKPTNLTSNRILFHIPRNTTAAHGQVLCFLRTTGKIDFSIDTTSYFGRSTAVISAGTWHHVFLGIDLSIAGDIQIFIDGNSAKASSNLWNRHAFSTATDGLFIGEEAQGWLLPFLGNMDEFAIWANEDLSSDIADIYNSGTPPNLNDLSSTPTGWWRMGENGIFSTNWALTDQGSGSNNATSANMVEAGRQEEVP